MRDRSADADDSGGGPVERAHLAREVEPRGRVLEEDVGHDHVGPPACDLDHGVRGGAYGVHDEAAHLENHHEEVAPVVVILDDEDVERSPSCRARARVSVPDHGRRAAPSMPARMPHDLGPRRRPISHTCWLGRSSPSMDRAWKGMRPQSKTRMLTRED